MSAEIPETMLLSDLLKATGYDCPDDLKGLTFEEATSGSQGLSYHLYAWKLSIDDTTIGYTEHPIVQKGDVFLLPENLHQGAITDVTKLNRLDYVDSVSDAEHIMVDTGGGSSIPFTRNPEHDYKEVITDIRGIADLATKGLHVSVNGTLFKAVNVAVE